MTAGRWTPILFALAACHGDVSTDATGTDSTEPSVAEDASPGVRVPTNPPPAALAYADAIRELARQAGVEVDLAAAAHRPTYRWSTDYDAATGRLQGTETFRWVNDGPALETLTFAAHTVHAGSAGVAPMLATIEIDGAPVPARTDDSLVYKLSQRLETGAAIAVTFHFTWDLPARSEPAATNDSSLATTLGLARSLDPSTYEGRSDALAVVEGLPVRWHDPRDFAFHLETTIRTTGDLRAVATGVDVGRERAGAARAARFVAMNAHGAALMVGHGWTEREVQVGRVGLAVWTLPMTEIGSAATPHDTLALGRVRRALETLAESWGPCPEARVTVIEVAGTTAGVASLPGMLLVTWPPARVPGTEGIPALAEALARHPAREETMTLALAEATAREWWQGRGADAESENLLSYGLGTAGALRVVTAIDGDKARRRAIELGLHIPFALGHEGGAEPVLARLSASPAASPAMNPDSERAQLKAGLWAERLERHMGEGAFAEAARTLLGGAAPIDREALESAFLAHAARVDETRALLRRWLDEAHAGEDVGSLDAGVLAEYLLVDGAIGGLENELLRGPLGPRLLEALKQGKGIDPSLAIDALEGLTGTPSNPTLKAAMDVGRLVLGNDPETKKSVAGQLVEEIGRELGISPAERARLKMMTGLALDALHAQRDGNATDPPRDPPNKPELRPR